MSFLALGNGAPDISASIAAISSGNYELALGALLGGPLPSQTPLLSLPRLPVHACSLLHMAMSEAVNRDSMQHLVAVGS